MNARSVSAVRRACSRGGRRIRDAGAHGQTPPRGKQKQKRNVPHILENVLLERPPLRHRILERALCIKDGDYGAAAPELTTLTRVREKLHHRRALHLVCRAVHGNVKRALFCVIRAAQNDFPGPLVDGCENRLGCDKALVAVRREQVQGVVPRVVQGGGVSACGEDELDDLEIARFCSEVQEAHPSRPAARFDNFIERNVAEDFVLWLGSHEEAVDIADEAVRARDFHRDLEEGEWEGRASERWAHVDDAWQCSTAHTGEREKAAKITTRWAGGHERTIQREKEIFFSLSARKEEIISAARCCSICTASVALLAASVAARSAAAALASATSSAAFAASYVATIAASMIASSARLVAVAAASRAWNVARAAASCACWRSRRSWSARASASSFARCAASAASCASSASARAAAALRVAARSAMSSAAVAPATIAVCIATSARSSTALAAARATATAASHAAFVARCSATRFRTRSANSSRSPATWRSAFAARTAACTGFMTMPNAAQRSA